MAISLAAVATSSNTHAFLVFATVGGSFFLSAAQCAFNNQLLGALAVKLPEIDPAVALGIGATQIREAFESSQVALVIDAYMVGLRAVFAIAVAAFAMSSIVGLFGSWKKLHGEELKKSAGGAA